MTFLWIRILRKTLKTYNIEKRYKQKQKGISNEV